MIVSWKYFSSALNPSYLILLPCLRELYDFTSHCNNNIFYLLIKKEPCILQLKCYFIDSMCYMSHCLYVYLLYKPLICFAFQEISKLCGDRGQVMLLLDWINSMFIRSIKSILQALMRLLHFLALWEEDKMLPIIINFKLYPDFVK